MAAMPPASPSIVSVRLIVLIIPTIQITVIGTTRAAGTGACHRRDRRRCRRSRRSTRERKRRPSARKLRRGRQSSQSSSTAMGTSSAAAQHQAPHARILVGVAGQQHDAKASADARQAPWHSRRCVAFGAPEPRRGAACRRSRPSGRNAPAKGTRAMEVRNVANSTARRPKEPVVHFAVSSRPAPARTRASLVPPQCQPRRSAVGPELQP